MAKSPFDYAGIINSKSDAFPDLEDYNNFMMNRIFSNTANTIFYANEINVNCDIQLNFDFYYNGLSKKKRYGKWHKRPKDDKKVLEVLNRIIEYYGCSMVKAQEIYDILESNNLLNDFAEKSDHGGKCK